MERSRRKKSKMFRSRRWGRITSKTKRIMMREKRRLLGISVCRADTNIDRVFYDTDIIWEMYFVPWLVAHKSEVHSVSNDSRLSDDYCTILESRAELK